MSKAGTGAVSDRSDMPRGHWIDRVVPAGARPYLRLMRIDRPIGTWLLLLPGWWAIALAAPDGGWPDFRLLALFAVGYGPVPALGRALVPGQGAWASAARTEGTPWLVNVTETGRARPGRDSVCAWIGCPPGADAQAP